MTVVDILSHLSWKPDEIQYFYKGEWGKILYPHYTWDFMDDFGGSRVKDDWLVDCRTNTLYIEIVEEDGSY